MRTRPKAVKPEHTLAATFELDANAAACQSIVWEFDKAIHEAEDVWGVDRLPYLAPAPMRLAWWHGMDALTCAIHAKDPAATRRAVDNLLKGLRMMIAAAQKAGEEPLAADVWEAPLNDGRVLRVVRWWPEGAAPVTKDRNVVTWSLDEVARLVEREGRLVNAVKKQWPGAAVQDPKPVSKLSKGLNDEIPW